MKTLQRCPVLLAVAMALEGLGILTATSVKAQENLADVIDRSERSVVRIEVTGVADGLGSGFIVASDGLLVTNVHVLAGAEKAVAFFRDGASFKINGTYFIDENKDICVAKIDAVGLPVIPLASQTPRKGEAVIALGSPKGLSFSAARGIVSAIRGEEEAKTMIGRPNIEGTWIQVDTPLSGGNSGGPLINAKGEVVAMSTLASQGSAHDLNFGISVMDILPAIATAKKSRLLALNAGVGKIDMGEVAPESGALITRGEIPERALQQYLERGRDEYSVLSRDIKKSSREADELLTELKRGKIGTRGPVVEVLPGRNSDRYFFPSESVKARWVARQQTLASRLKEIKSNLASKPNDESVFNLLMYAGPRLDPRNPNAVGFMSNATVLHAFNEHDVMVVYDNAPYLLWVKSTVGLAAGQKVTPCPVYVAGTKTAQIPGGGSQALTVLNSITETEIRQAVFGDTAETLAMLQAEYRIWTDITGDHTVEALLVEINDTEVILKKKEDDTVIPVPLDRLSKEDRKLIGK